MSERSWSRLDQRRLTRRAMLGWSARLGVGAAGLALVGCGDDDDDDEAAQPAAAAPAQPEPQAEPEAQAQAEPEPQAEPAEQAEMEAEVAEEPEEEPALTGPPPTIVVEEIVLAGLDGTVTLANVSADPINLEGWFVCRRPAYWPLPAIELAAGESIVLHAGDGENTERDFFAQRGFNALGSSGELGIYRDFNFDSADSMVAYVSWGGGGGRKSVAQAAGLWGEENLAAEAGDVIRRTGDGLGLPAYSVA